MEIIQVVGYKNSGKTTLSTKMIQSLVQQGIRTASLKHHGHGGIPIGLEDTDSYMHKEAGAYIAGVEGGGIFQLFHKVDWKVEQLISIYELMDIEVLVVEGFKEANYSKIVLIEKEEDLSLLKQLTNIIAVVSAVSIEGRSIPYPVFSRSQLEEVCQYYLQYYVVN